MITEDTYGCDFLKGVRDRLAEEGLLRGKQSIQCHHMGILRNKDVGRMVKAALLDRGDDKVLIVVDADGRSREDVESDVVPFVRRGMRGGRTGKGNIEELMGRVRLVVFAQEAEEWILASIGRTSVGRKPSDFLRMTRRYEKRELPKFVRSLDLGALKKMRSFKDFIEALDDPLAEAPW
jgi:hypothetical protein